MRVGAGTNGIYRRVPVEVAAELCGSLGGAGGCITGVFQAFAHGASCPATLASVAMYGIPSAVGGAFLGIALALSTRLCCTNPEHEPDDQGTELTTGVLPEVQQLAGTNNEEGTELMAVRLAQNYTGVH